MGQVQQAWPVLVDIDDPRLAPLRALPTRAAVPGDPLVVEGAIAVARALAGPARVRAIVGTAAHLGRLAPAHLPEHVWQVQAALLRAVVGFDFHRGIVALVDRPASRPAAVAEILARPRLTVLVLERLADPANVGAVIRTAAALGVDLVVCDAAGADPYGRRALRASMGHALTRLPWVSESPAAVVAELAHAGAQVLAATTDASAVDLGEMKRAPRTVILVGNEGTGLSATLCAHAHARVTIPIAPDADSLNVAAATAIVLYALR